MQSRPKSTALNKIIKINQESDQNLLNSEPRRLGQDDSIQTEENQNTRNHDNLNIMKGVQLSEQPISLQVRQIQTEDNPNFTFNQSTTQQSGRGRTRSRVEQELLADAHAAALMVGVN